MAKKDNDDTIENRVYLFESLASSYVQAASEELGSDDEAARRRARRALAELAYVSCIVADTGALTPEEVRDRILGASESPKDKARERGQDDAKPSKKRK
jgi:predicted nuclease of restriction endonuclease-like RecB superfamily